MFSKLRQALQEFISRVRTVELNEKNLEPLLNELLFKLLESDVALSVAEEVIDEVKNDLLGKRVERGREKIEVLVRDSLKKALMAMLDKKPRPDLISLAKAAKGDPLVVLFLGPNGHGKTTTIAKLAYHLLKNGISVVLACSDTFRAGAEEQLEIHAKRLGVKVIKHRYGADPAAVAYDAVVHAKSKGISVVLIDTAGRMQTNKNLMEELRKIARVVKPDLKILVVDALTGNDAVEQATVFDREVGVDAIILTKADADARGGAALSISKVLNKPVIYIGTGQAYEDLLPFDPEWFIKRVLA